jgi:CTP synthase
VNNAFRPKLVEAGLVVSGTFQEGPPRRDDRAPRTTPGSSASQYHPEFKSRPTRPAPLFRDFVGAAVERARARAGVGQAAAHS